MNTILNFINNLRIKKISINTFLYFKFYKMYKKKNYYSNDFFLSKEQRIFIKNNNQFKKKNKIKKFRYKKKILVQINNRNFNLLLIKLFKYKFLESFQFTGIYTMSLFTYNNFYFFSETIYKIKNKIANYLLFNKWKNLYASIGVKTEYNVNKTNNNHLSNIKIVNRIFLGLKNKKSVLRIRYRNILIGDLIYDTFIRYGLYPTINTKNILLKIIIEKSIEVLDYCFLNLKHSEIEKYYTSYSSYINHGLVVRYFIKIGVPVFACGGNAYFKKLNSKDFKHTPNFISFKKKYEKLNNKKYKILEAKKLLEKKINGQKEISSNYYLNNFSYKKNNMDDSNIKELDGIIFLHDFFDACHDFDGLIFEDFYEWTLYSLNIIKKFKLKIGIKPHPNNINESKKIIKILKMKYKDLVWIDERISNLKILKYENIKFGISATGSILYELAFFSKMGISAGYSPTISFKISKNAKNKLEYKNYLINATRYAKNYRVSKLDACKVYYMYFLYNLKMTKKYLIKSDLLNFDAQPYKKLNFYDDKINKIINDKKNI